MAIAVRFLSGSLEGREFEVDKDAIRIGDAPDADIPIDPDQRDNGGARDRIVEILRVGDTYRVHSAGNREISAQGDTAIDRNVPPGEEIRFGAWGPVLTILEGGRRRESTNPVLKAVPDEMLSSPPAAPPPLAPGDSSAARRAKLDGTGGFRTASGEKPVGPKTVYMMIQDALGKAKETEGGFARGSVFIREVVTDSIHNATRSFKIGIALLGAALLILIAILFYNIAATKQTVVDVSRSADKRVAEVRTEMSGELTTLKKGRDELAKEADGLTQRLGELEKSKDADQKVLADLRGRLAAAESKRRDLEQKMIAALSQIEADRKKLDSERERLEKERAAELERQRAESARAPSASAPEPATSAAPTQPPQ
jgi:hypothetical protein